MKLWDKGAQISSFMEEFTVGNDRECDAILARWDVIGSIAHARMLGDVGLVEKDESHRLVNALSSLLNQIDEHGITINQDCEDIHSYIENHLTEVLGDTGKRIHLGRSRNDQILTAIKLFLRHELSEVIQVSSTLAKLLTDRALEFSNHLIPGFTHFQPAMPSSFGLWFGGYAEAISEDIRILRTAADAADTNPLGSAAGYGSTLPVDREQTLELLEFDRLNITSTYAQMTRGRTEKLASVAIAFLASTLSKWATDIILYVSPGYNFLTLPDEFTTGSSIMPHKKNPDIFELIRARCNRLQSVPIEIGFIVNNLPSGYHRDFQLTKQAIINAISDIKSCLNAAILVTPYLLPVPDILKRPEYRYVGSVERINELVYSGVAFRDAYRQVAQEIEGGSYCPPDDSLFLNTKGHIGSIGNPGLDRISIP